jgi:hypothetical protein
MNDRNPSRADETSCIDELAGRKNVTEARRYRAVDPHQDPNA